MRDEFETRNYEGKLQSNLTTVLNFQRHISLATIVADRGGRKEGNKKKKRSQCKGRQRVRLS